MSRPYDFSELAHFDRSTLPDRQSVAARDGTPLALRRYESASDTVVLALHGSSGDGTYFHPLATYLADHDHASVFVPDLRGHGRSGGRRGDVDYIGQMEDDVSDLIALVRSERPGARVVLLGHSSGGGLAIRFAGGRRAEQTEKDRIDGYVLLAPFLGPDAPTTRTGSGGWASPDIPAIMEIVEQTRRGDTSGHDRVTLRFNKPREHQTGREVLEYTFRMMVAYHAREDFASDLRAITSPLLVVAGALDESFVPEQYEPTIAPHAGGEFAVLPELTHFGVVLDPAAHSVIGEWIRALTRNGV